MERGGWTAQTAFAHDGLLLEVQLQKAVHADAVGVPRPEREVLRTPEVPDRLRDGDLHGVFQTVREYPLAPRGDLLLGELPPPCLRARVRVV